VHQTTLRFPEDLWRLLELEAKALGISVAQYVREAALARVAYDAGRRGESLFIEPAMLGAPSEPVPAAVAAEPAAQPTPGIAAGHAIAAASETVIDSSAVWAQARLVRRRAEQLREQARTHHRRRTRPDDAPEPPA
jgi:zinc transporter ZupT